MSSTLWGSSGPHTRSREAGAAPGPVEHHGVPLIGHTLDVARQPGGRLRVDGLQAVREGTQGTLSFVDVQCIAYNKNPDNRWNSEGQG